MLPTYAGSMWKEGEQWFGKKPRGDDKKKGDQKGSGGEQPDDEGEGGTTPVVPMILANDTDLNFGWRKPETDQDSAEPDFSRYARDPMEHQRKAVLWLLRHAHRALRRRESRMAFGGTRSK